MLSPLLLALALASVQSPTAPTVVRGTVLRHDGSRVTDATVELSCGLSRRTTTTSPEGTFAFADVRESPCVLRVEAAGTADRRLVATLSLERPGDVSVVLQEAPMQRDDVEQAASERLARQLNLIADGGARKPARPFDSWVISGGGAWSHAGTLQSGVHGGRTAAIDMTSPIRGIESERWKVGISVARKGPWGTLFTGSISQRRQLGATTLLSDVTGGPPPGPGSWSLLVDPSRPPTIWDARVRLERGFTVGDVDLTIFGEAYSSYQGRASLQQPLPPALAKSLRTGTAGRVGVKVGF